MPTMKCGNPRKRRGKGNKQQGDFNLCGKSSNPPLLPYLLRLVAPLRRRELLALFLLPPPLGRRHRRGRQQHPRLPRRDGAQLEGLVLLVVVFFFLLFAVIPLFGGPTAMMRLLGGGGCGAAGGGAGLARGWG